MSAPVTEIQSEGFTPHGIYDFRSGLNLQREPWLSPENAWEEITNGYVFRGRTHKRYGYNKFAELSKAITGEELDAANTAKPITGGGVTDGDPVVVNLLSHGYVNGDVVEINGSEQTELNGWSFIVANKTEHTFELTDGGGDVDGTGKVHGGTFGNVTLHNTLTGTLDEQPVTPRFRHPDFTTSPDLPAIADPYSVRIYEHTGGTTTPQVAKDFPLNIDSAASGGATGLLVMEIVDEAVGTTDGTTVTNLNLKHQPLRGVYANWDFTSSVGYNPAVHTDGLAHLDASPVNWVITDPLRELPFPQGVAVTFSGTPGISNDFRFQPESHYFSAGSPQGQYSQRFNEGVGGATAESSIDVFDSNRIKTHRTDSGGGILGQQFDDPALAVAQTVTATYYAVVGTINYTTGAIVLDWPAATTAEVRVDYEYGDTTADPVMGIHNFFDLEGTEILVALTNKNLWRFDTATSKRFEMQGGPSADWTGDATEFYDFTDFEGLLFINNGKDHTKKFDPGADTVTLADTKFDQTNNQQIQSARICLRHKNRMIYFHTKEGTGPTSGGETYKNRARWTPVNAVEWEGATDAAADDFVDAPVEDSIISAFTVGEEIIVGFERSWWRLRYTGDANLAFKWEPLLGEEGASGLNSIARLPERVFARGEKSLVSVDSVSQRPADQLIPELTTTWNAAARHQSNSHYSKELREILMTYAEAGISTADSVLATHVDETRTQYSYSVYKPDTPWNCFGTFRETSTKTHNSTFQSHNELVGTTYNDTLGAIGTPLVLVGDRAGVIWNYGQGYKDHLLDVTATFRTKRLNPTPFFRSHLGWIDIICGAVIGATLTVRLSQDYSSGFYLTKEISLEPNGASSKVKRRIPVNKVANFHSVGLEISSGGPFELDALILYTRPVGVMRDIG